MSAGHTTNNLQLFVSFQEFWILKSFRNFHQVDSETAWGGRVKAASQHAHRDNANRLLVQQVSCSPALWCSVNTEADAVGSSVGTYTKVWRHSIVKPDDGAR